MNFFFDETLNNIPLFITVFFFRNLIFNFETKAQRYIDIHIRVYNT